VIAVNPTDVRKAAAFVEAIAAVEESFGFQLGVGTLQDAGGDFFDPVTFGAGEDSQPYVLIRKEPEGDLVLGMATE
jgi:hypothetical protein